MGKITVEVKINTFGTMLYSLNHPNIPYLYSYVKLLGVSYQEKFAILIKKIINNYKIFGLIRNKLRA